MRSFEMVQLASCQSGLCGRLVRNVEPFHPIDFDHFAASRQAGWFGPWHIVGIAHIDSLTAWHPLLSNKFEGAGANSFLEGGERIGIGNPLRQDKRDITA